MYRAVVTLLSLIALLAPIPAQAEEWVRYSDPEAGFSVSYPKGWVVETTPLPDATVIVYPGTDLEVPKCVVSHSRYLDEIEVSPETLFQSFSPQPYLDGFKEKYGASELLDEGISQLSGQVSKYAIISYLKLNGRSDQVQRVINSVTFTASPYGPYMVGCSVWGNSVSDVEALTEKFRDSFQLLKESRWVGGN